MQNDNAMELSIKRADLVSVVTYGCVGLHHRARASMNPMTKNKRHFCSSIWLNIITFVFSRLRNNRRSGERLHTIDKNRVAKNLLIEHKSS